MIIVFSIVGWSIWYFYPTLSYTGKYVTTIQWGDMVETSTVVIGEQYNYNDQVVEDYTVKPLQRMLWIQFGDDFRQPVKLRWNSIIQYGSLPPSLDFSGWAKYRRNNKINELLSPLHKNVKGECVFPELVPKNGLPNGYSWQLSNGPDFYVYDAVKTNSNSGAGIYFGLHPDSKRGTPKSNESGRLGAISVQWDVLDGSYPSRPFYRQTLTSYQPTPKHEKIYLDAWVYADSYSEVKALQDGLEKMEFKLVTYEEHKKLANQSSEPTRNTPADEGGD